MTGKRLAVALAAALGMTAVNAAPAEDAGLYFAVTGGMTSIDLGSKRELDEAFAIPLAEELLDAGFDAVDITTSLDDSDIGWGIDIGYRFNRYFAAEIGYVDLGEASYVADMDVTVVGATFPVEASIRFASAGPIAAAVAMLPVNERFDVHAKVGMYFAESELRTRVRDMAFDENLLHEEIGAGEQEVFAGIGAAWNVNDSYSLRFEYRRFLDVGDDESGEEDIDLLAVSMLFR
jgi:opacity protein-like surface antigen